VVTSFLGRGLLAEADAPLVGTYLGRAGDPQVTALVEDSDALFLLGEIFSDTNFGVSQRRVDLRRTIHALDTQVTISYHTYDGIPLASLVESLERIARPVVGDPRALAPRTPPHSAALRRDDTHIVPEDIAAAINELMREHGKFPIAADIGDCLFTAMDLVNTDHVAPGYYATMGFAVPAALGVQLATGRRPIALVGDGAFAMTGLELGHCARLGLDPIVVVLNNAGWGMLSAFRPGARYTDLGRWNFAALADALGGRGRRAETRGELADALEQAARERGVFQLIDARVAPGDLSERLRRFAGSILGATTKEVP
jgi:indolepyruvate decarboxylase